MEHLQGQLNGTPALPAINVGWDADKQIVRLAFDEKDFKTWNFVIAALEMAVQLAKDKHQESLTMQRIQRLQQQAQDQAIASQIKLGR